MIPRVTVLMAVYNGERYLAESIDSVLKQTYADFEFLILDDGSTDRTGDIIASFADRRIRAVRNEGNIGLTKSLNKGLDLAKGEYIARQDADDVSLQERLEREVRFLDENPQVGVVGSWVDYIDGEGRCTDTWRTPGSAALVQWSLLFGNCIAHPSVVMRRNLLNRWGAYRPDIAYAQDYDLWVRLSRRTRIANLSESLYLRRVHHRMVGVVHRREQDRAALLVMQQAMQGLFGSEVSESLVAKLRQSSSGGVLDTPAELEAVARLILSLYRRFLTRNPLCRLELVAVRKDVGCRLKRLALTQAVHHPVSAYRVLLQATRVERRLPLITCLEMISRLLGTRGVKRQTCE
jgi:hypothetical protein